MDSPVSVKINICVKRELCRLIIKKISRIMSTKYICIERLTYLVINYVLFSELFVCVGIWNTVLVKCFSYTFKCWLVPPKWCPIH